MFEFKEVCMNVVDIVIIVIVLIAVIVGCFQGFIKSFSSLFSGFINIVLCIVATKPLSTLLNRWFGLQSAISSSIETSLVNGCADWGTNMVGLATQEEINTHIQTTLQNGTKSECIRKYLTGLFQITPENLANKETFTLGGLLGQSLGTFISLVISFILVGIVILIVKTLLNKLCKKVQASSLNWVDRTFGGIFGLVRGFTYVVIIFAILSYFTEISFLQGFFVYIDNSYIGGYISQHVFGFMHQYLSIKNILYFIADQL